MKAIFFLFCLGVLTQFATSIRPMRMVTKKVIIRPSTNVTIDSDFAVRFFYQQLLSPSTMKPTVAGAKPTGPQNILFSPISIVTILLALAEGANGTTADELYQTLNTNAQSQSSVRPSMSHRLNLLNKASHHHVLSMANRLFVDKDFSLASKFENLLQTYYRMNAERLSFDAPKEAEQRINEWVSKETRRQITSILPPGTIDAMTRLVLANGVYFKGDWEVMFDEKSTDIMPFYVSKDRQVQVPFMFVEAPLPYFDFERLGFEMLELPYSGKEVSMFVVLPYATQSIMTVARRLKSRPFLLCHRLKRLQSSNKVDVMVRLPKFTFQHSLNMKDALESMGVSDVFDSGRSDLSKMADEAGLSVSDAFHKAAIEVSERGTTASATSAMVIRGRSMNSNPVFRADRPFIFFIRHNPTSSVLFMGAINDFPEDNST